MIETTHVMFGDGGHASSVWSALGDLKVAKVALISPHEPVCRPDLERIGEDSVSAMPSENTTLINGLGQLETHGPRTLVFDTFTARGFDFLQVTHPHSYVDSLVELGDAVQVLAGVVIGPHASIDVNTILNTGSVVEHGCTVGKHVHIGPGATLCGEVTIGDHSIVGPGATIVRGVSIGARSIVAAGAVVTSNVPPESLMMGVPARPQTQ